MKMIRWKKHVFFLEKAYTSLSKLPSFFFIYFIFNFFNDVFNSCMTASYLMLGYSLIVKYKCNFHLKNPIKSICYYVLHLVD